MNNTRFVYVRDEKGFPIGCIAYRFEREDIVTYGFSVYNPVQKFDRRIARQVAEGRMSHGLQYLYTGASKHPNEVLAGLCHFLSGMTHLPWFVTHTEGGTDVRHAPALPKKFNTGLQALQSRLLRTRKSTTAVA